jgi:hypothetical protein
VDSPGHEELEEPTIDGSDQEGAGSVSTRTTACRGGGPAGDSRERAGGVPQREEEEGRGEPPPRQRR